VDYERQITLVINPLKTLTNYGKDFLSVEAEQGN